MKTLIAIIGGLFLTVVPAGLSFGVVPTWVERIGWTLVHSVWQVAAIACVAALLFRCLQNRSARVRYTVGVATLSLMVASLCTTFVLIEATPARSAVSLINDIVPGRKETVVREDMRSPVTIEQTRIMTGNETPLVEPETLEPSRNLSAAVALPETEVLLVPESKTAELRDRLNTFAARVRPRLPWLVGLWLVGMLVCALRPVWGLWMQWQLRRTGLLPVPNAIQDTTAAVARKIGLTRFVAVTQSTLVKVPLVIGYLRPMILLPGSVVTGLTAAQLEAVLAHELAHVRRHDWLINTLQVMVETVLFYHPAVWWLSKRIRTERELCCDDVALALNVDKAVYARTLLTLEELRQNTVAPALAATGGDLAGRVRRLLPVGEETPSGSGALAGLLAVAISLTLLATSLASPNPQEPDTVEVSSHDKSEPVAVESGEQEKSPAAENEKEETAEDRETQPPSNKPASLRKRSVQILDENNQPIAGATVRFQFQNGRQGWLSNDETTGKNGIVAVESPPKAETAYVNVKAAGFGQFNETQQATGHSIVRLKRGRVIHVRAVDEAGQVLDKAVPLLEQSRIYGREFKLQDDGSFKSPAVEKSRRLMRVVSDQEKGTMLFSDLVDVETAQADKDGVLQLVLKPGTQLTGRLDDSVPRPVSEGYVHLMVVEGPEHQLDPGHNRFRTNAWAWEDLTAVQPDGTFTFDSVPAGGHAQLHAVVDGYMSVNPPIEDLVSYFRTHGMAEDETEAALRQRVATRTMWPHLVPLDQPNASVTINCRPTASCDFRILDPAGNPVQDAMVSFSPNGIFINGGLFIPGSISFDSASLVHVLFHRDSAALNENRKGELSPRETTMRMLRAWGQRSFLGATSDADGRVKIRNLPGSPREGFRVTADGFVLPRSPLYPPMGDRREQYIRLIAGETVEATIYLERELSTVEREILVVDEKGHPLSGATVTLAELRVGPKDWQMWSTQRFGTLQSARTDANGRVVLNAVTIVEDTAVQKLRLAISYQSNEDRSLPKRARGEQIWLNGAVVDLPLDADKGVVAVKRNPDAGRPGQVIYGNLDDILNGSDTAALLQTMIDQPGLPILRQLLSAADTPQPQPIELLDDGRTTVETKGPRVHVIEQGDFRFALVSARVRPVDGTRASETKTSRLPECIFVFDKQGKLLATLGGRIGTTGAGSPENVDIVNLGPKEDWFVRVTKFQKNDSFDYQSAYYRIAVPVRKSLKYYHYPNSNAWSQGPRKIRRHGGLYFEFPDSRNNRSGETVGTTPDGVSVNGMLTWDGNTNQFRGAVAQTSDGRPLYKVDSEWSTDFTAVKPKADQLILSGGARDYGGWYGWNTVVPEGFEAVVTVSIPQIEGDPKTMTGTYGPGRQIIQFQAAPDKDGKSASLQLGYGDEEIHKAAMPISLSERSTKHSAIVNIAEPGKSLKLVEHSVQGSGALLTVEVKLWNASQ